MAMGDTGGRIDALLRGIVGEYLGNFEEAAGHSAALAQFGYLTMSGGEWDHKPQLQQRFALESSDFRTEILANGQGGKLLYDVWSNIHFGYAGRAAGFGRGELIVGSHGTGAAFGATDEGGGDDISITVGMDLYDRLGPDITEMDLHRAIVDAIPGWQAASAGSDDSWEYKVIP